MQGLWLVRLHHPRACGRSLNDGNFSTKACRVELMSPALEREARKEGLS